MAPPEAAGGRARPSPTPHESALRPTRQTRAPFVQPGRTNAACVQLRAGQCERDWTAPTADRTRGGRDPPSLARPETLLIRARHVGDREARQLNPVAPPRH